MILVDFYIILVEFLHQHQILTVMHVSRAWTPNYFVQMTQATNNSNNRLIVLNEIQGHQNLLNLIDNEQTKMYNYYVMLV